MLLIKKISLNYKRLLGIYYMDQTLQKQKSQMKLHWEWLTQVTLHIIKVEKNG